MRKVLRNIDKPLLLVTALLFSIGLIMIFSASNVTAFMTKAESPYFYFLKQGFFLITGIFFIALPILRCPTKAYSKLSKLLMLIFTGLLVYVLAFSESVITISASGANAGYTNLWSTPIWASDCSYIDDSVTKNIYFWHINLLSL